MSKSCRGIVLWALLGRKPFLWKKSCRNSILWKQILQDSSVEINPEDTPICRTESFDSSFLYM